MRATILTFAAFAVVYSTPVSADNLKAVNTTSNGNKFVKNSVALHAAYASTSSTSPWAQLYQKCYTGWPGQKANKDGTSCLADAVTQLVNTALAYASTGSPEAYAMWNAVGAIQARDVDYSDSQAIWNSLSDADKEALRDNFAVPGLHLRSIIDAEEGIKDGHQLQFSQDIDSEAQLFHTTNGTHGAVRFVPQVVEKRDLFSWPEGIKGIKINYQVACGQTGMKSARGVARTDDLKDVIAQFVNWTKDKTSDWYFMELDVSDKATMMFTVIVETISFGTNWEAMPYAQIGKC